MAHQNKLVRPVDSASKVYTAHRYHSKECGPSKINCLYLSFPMCLCLCLSNSWQTAAQEDTEEHAKNLNNVLERFSARQITVNVEKCTSRMNKVELKG